MNSISVLGKYLDQPRLVGKFSNAVPAVLVGGGVAYTFNHVHKTPKEEKKKEFIKIVAVLTGTIASALIATRGLKPIKIGGKTLLKGFEGLSDGVNLKELAQDNKELISNFLKDNVVPKKTKEILGNFLEKDRNFKYAEIKTMFEELEGFKKPQGNGSKLSKGQEFLNELIPNPENVTSKEIFSEIKRLSLMGLVPVVGGITGGIVGDKLTEKDWKQKVPNKIKEGSYQYLANIFLCNIGAGGALALLERFNIKSKAARAVGMVSGILALGVVGGSAIANLIGKTCIDPILGCKNKTNGQNNDGLYSERKPEMLDVGLHMDDIATVAVLSGLKWIEPALPILYSISGFRAGIGYRNGDNKTQGHIEA